MVMVESSVPMPAMPMVPTKSGANISGHVSAAPTVPRKKKKNSGTQITSTISRNTRFAVAFAKKITERSIGTSKMLSKQPFSFSCENERFSPSRLVNKTTTHRRPPAIC